MSDELTPASVTIQALGETFEIAEKVGLAPLMRFAKVAASGLTTNEMRSLTVMSDLLEQCFATEAEFDRFMDLATVQRVGAEEILDVIKATIEVISARPTLRPSNYSDGPQSTSERSPEDSYSRVIREHEQQGRPDLALVYVRAREALAG